MRWTTVALPEPAGGRPPWLPDGPLRLPLADGAAPDLKRDAARLVDVLREERYAPAMRSATLALPFSYAVLPAWIRMLAARTLHLPTRFLRTRRDPPWPIAPAADALLALAGLAPAAPWGAARWAVAVTHDVDTAVGLRCAPAVADRVEAAGFRACFFVVADAVRSDPGILRELRARGHEIASHDVHHDNRVCFLPAAEREERLRRARASIEPYGGVGFRSPSLLRSADLVEAVGRHFGYDSSLCDTDLEHARGCSTVLPYRLRGCLELPVTLPMDSSLAYVGCAPDRAVALWREKCAYVRAVGGLAVLVTHTEPHLSGRGARLDALERFLAWVAEQPDCRVLLPREVAEAPAFAPAPGPAASAS